MLRLSRRNFLKTGVATGALAGMGGFPLLAEPARATDWVTLGKSDVKVTRLAFGTGTHNGAVQRQLGQDRFTDWSATPTITASAFLDRASLS